MLPDKTDCACSSDAIVINLLSTVNVLKFSKSSLKHILILTFLSYDVSRPYYLVSWSRLIFGYVLENFTVLIWLSTNLTNLTTNLTILMNLFKNTLYSFKPKTAKLVKP